MREWQRLGLIVGVFMVAYFVPFGNIRVQAAIIESLLMVREYAREHVLLCLVPAFFIAGAIGTFLSQAAVIRYFGSDASKLVSYSVASVSGTILAVCSCTVLPLFAGIYRRGAGIGPAIAFLYSGPAINVLAIILTARVLGWQMGAARAIGAVLFACIIGLIMAVLFRREEAKRGGLGAGLDTDDEPRSPAQNIAYFVTLVLILVFAAWGRPDGAIQLWDLVFAYKWYLVAGLLVILGYMLVRWFDSKERTSWLEASWGFARQILPLLLVGVLAAGLLMGRPDSGDGLIPAHYVSSVVGGNSVSANFIASLLGAVMYFATLTEVPILQGLLGAGMGKGPALALLLAGPALSLPNMLVIRSVIGTRKTLTFVLLVVVMATISGTLYGNLIP